MASGIPSDNVDHFAVRPLAILALVGLGALVSALVAYLPSRRAARLNAIEAIRAV